MSGIFGWSYPPGCSGPPNEDYRCEVCLKDCDDCICPECPECGVHGGPDCYEPTATGHALVRSPEQIASHKEVMDYIEGQAEAEHEYWSKRIEEDENTG
jgi:hypothetical protein